MNQEYRMGGGPRIPRCFVALVAVVMSLAGCAVSVDGTAGPGARFTARPLSGSTIKQVLLGPSALSRILNQSFRIDPHLPPRFGGPEALRDDGWDSPGDCLGVAAVLQQDVYQSSKVTHAAVETWRHVARSTEGVSVTEGVVSLPTAGDAQALFAKFSEQWQQCSGTTNTDQTGPISTTNVISDIRVTDTVVAATNTATAVLPNMPPLLPTPQARALGVRLNCLVEVEVVFFGDRRPSDPGSANLDTSGTDIAHAMMDRVSALS